MSRAEAAGRPVFEFRAAGAAWDAEFLERVAIRWAHAPIGLGLLVERHAGRPAPFLVPSTPEGAMLVASAADGLPGRLHRRSALPAGPEAPGGSVAFAVLAPSGGPAPEVRPGSPDEPRTLGGPAPTPLPFRPAAEGFDDHPGVSVQWHWFPGGPEGLRVWARVRLAVPPARHPGDLLAVATPLAERLGGPGPGAVRPKPVPAGWRVRRAWDRGTLPGLCARVPLFLPPVRAASAVPGPPAPAFPRPEDLALHTVVVGASGSGKTSLLASVAADRLRAGGSVVLFDVHGDLAPATAALLRGSARPRIAAVDVEGATAGSPGVRVLAPDAGAESEAAELVAALKRLSVEGSEVFWGFRLERLFDTFVRLTLEEGGDLADLAELLSDPRRREAARLTTRRPEIARFLEELPALERRNPEFLWPAAARVTKVLLSDRLRRLLAPPDGGLELGPWLAGGGSLMVRIPFHVLGPEASSFAATLLATRAYLAATRSPAPPGHERLFVLDEAHAFSPRLVAEILAEGRKFGVALLLATQYPERWSNELRAAAAGAAGSHVLFRIPAPAARTTGPWIGLSDPEARRWLPVLPAGHALVATPGVPARLVATPPLPSAPEAAWGELVGSTADVSGCPVKDGPLGWTEEEQVLFEVWGSQERGEPLPWDPVGGPRSSVGGSGDRRDSEVARLLRRGWLEVSEGRLGITPAGARALGIGAPTGAARESEEHRALLVEAARIFARHGLRMEAVRQGRFDTRLPDGRVRIAGGPTSALSPGELYERLARHRDGWGWRYFRGRDVHIEAEVSGALRPERIRRGLSKGNAAGAFVLFLVGDPVRARRVRAVLVAAGVHPHRSVVWTLPRAARRDPDGRLHR